MIVNMRIVWFCFFMFQTVFALEYYVPVDADVCRKWECVNEKLGFESTLNRGDFVEILMRIQPYNPRWRNVVEKILHVCYSYHTYGNSTSFLPAKYFNFPCEEKFLYCVIDQLYELCPKESLNYMENCSPLEYSWGNNRYLLQQRRQRNSYRSNLNYNLTYYEAGESSIEYRKCCNLPSIVNVTVASECGINNVVLRVSDGGSYARVEMEMSGSYYLRPDIYSLFITFISYKLIY